MVVEDVCLRKNNKPVQVDIAIWWCNNNTVCGLKMFQKSEVMRSTPPHLMLAQEPFTCTSGRAVGVSTRSRVLNIIRSGRGGRLPPARGYSHVLYSSITIY